MSRQNVARRTRSRGAAMVEAAVVMPLLILFFGLQAYIYSLYTVKQEAMMESRSQAFHAALKGCDGKSAQMPVQPLEGGPSADAVAGAADLKGLAEGKSGVTTGKSRVMTASNAYISNQIITRNDIVSYSYVYCNTKSGFVGFLHGMKDTAVMFVKTGFQLVKSLLD